MGNRSIFKLEELIRDDFEEYLGGIRDFSNCAACLDAYNPVCLQWSEELGTGFVSHIKLRDGLTLSIGSALFHEPVQIHFDSWHVPLTFSYGISGSVHYTIELENGAASHWCAEPGQSAVACFREFKGRVDYPANTLAKNLSIYVDPLLLHTLIDLKTENFPRSICDVASGSHAVEYQKNFATSPAMNMAIHQILNCPYQEPLQRLYLEGYTLVLLTHTLARLSPSGKTVQKTATVRPQDVERVKYARELIRNNLQNPPTLLELARTVGLHHSKLNAGFREMYGTTIFDYLRQTRLLMAKSLLDDGRMNVSEAAFAVGYASPSHFVKSFKNAYGTSPGAYLRTVSRKW
ncbi:MAG: hypothetical protein CSA22_01195 [Deltaproteobacteria bacterium]|nr:MAG: hypothetical protein CSA22_01195 [Deltaproteobacteria bacterium]